MDSDPANRVARPSFPRSELAYELPEALIATKPPPRREDARLLILDPPEAGRPLSDGRIIDLPDLLNPGDLLVLNDTKVIPAKFTARRRTGGRVQGLYIEEDKQGVWLVMLEGSSRLRVGETLTISAGLDNAIALELIDSCGEGQWRVAVDRDGAAEEILDSVGEPPLPPYIQRRRVAPTDVDDRSRYQTVYARKPGAIAAPTAGLHLTESLLARIRDRGVSIAVVTLHVGVGTFKPIKVDELSNHTMHGERYELPEAAAEAIRACRVRGGRVVAVGTTSVRVLESAPAGAGEARTVASSSGTTHLFIYPPYEFRVVDALLTNFPLPQSTLLALVMTLAGVEPVREAYRHAIKQEYRFYSYGDAMLIQ